MKLQELEMIRFLKLHGASKVDPSLMKQYMDALELINEFRFPQLTFVLKEYPRIHGVRWTPPSEVKQKKSNA